MTIPIDKNNPIYIKTVEFSKKFRELSEDERKSKIEDIALELLNDNKNYTTENKKSIASLVLNNSYRDWLCSKIGIENININPKPPQNITIQELEQKHKIVNKDIYDALLILNKYKISTGLTEHQKLYICTIVPRKDMDSVLLFGSNIIVDNCNPLDKIRIIKAIYDLSLNEIKNEMKIALNEEWAPEIKKNPSSEIADAFEFSLKLITKEMSPEEKLLIFGAFLEIPHNERASIADCGPNLLRNEKDPYQKYELLKGFSEIPENDRASIAEHAPKLFSKGMDSWDKEDLMIKLSEIPENDRASVAEHAPKLFREGKHSYDNGRMLQALFQIPEKDRASVAEHAPKFFSKGMDIHIKIDLLNHLAKVPQNMRSDLVHAAKLFSEEMAVKDRVQILDAFFPFPQNEWENISEISSQLLGKENDINNIISYINSVANITHGKRQKSFECALKIFRNEMKPFDKFTLLYSFSSIPERELNNVLARVLHLLQNKTIDYSFAPEVVKSLGIIPQNKREDLIDFAKFFFEKEMSLEEKSHIIINLSKTPPNFWPILMEYAPKLFNKNTNLFEKIEIVKALGDVPQKNEIPNVVKNTLEFFKKGMKEDAKFWIISGLSGMSQIELTEVAKQLELFNEEIDSTEKAVIVKKLSKFAEGEKVGIIKFVAKFLEDEMTTYEISNSMEILSQVPKEERKLFIESFPGSSLLKELLNDLNPILTYYLLPNNLRNKEFLESVKLVDKKLLKNKECRQALVNSCEEKLARIENLPPEVSLEISKFVCENCFELNLNEEHPVYFLAVYAQSILSDSDEKNMFGVLKKLTNLLKIPPDFQPEKSQVNGIEVSIDMKALETLSAGARIDRKQIPQDATFEAWNILLKDFKEKVESDFDKAYQAFQQLDPTLEVEPSTTWKMIQETAYNDPEKLLSSLLQLTGPSPSQKEAKWRAVLSNILSKSNEPKSDDFFTEKEAAFFLAMCVIQNCSGGKAQGIDAAYNLLEDKFKYKVKLSYFTSVNQILEDDRKLEGLKYVENKVKEYKTFNEKKDALIQEAEKDTRESSEKLSELLPDEVYWDVDTDNYTYTLNAKGAELVIKMTYQSVFDLISQIIMEYMEKQFTGEDALMKELTGTKNYDPAHQRIYLKNLIGPWVGLAKEINIDKHSRLIVPQLFEMPREDVLKVFFNHVTPATMVKELIQVVNSNEKYQEVLNPLLGQEDLEDKNLNQTGALELLKLSGFLKTDSKD